MKTRTYLFPLVTVVPMMLVGSAIGGQISDLQLYDGWGAPTATINYTNANGTGSNSAYVYADPQVSANSTAPIFYCVDLWHDNGIGDTYTITPVASMTFANSTFGDVDNRIGWLISQDQSTQDERAAVQLAIWYTVDNNGFSMSTSDNTITADYNSLISFAGYHPATTYNADFWQATHNANNTLYQDLASAGTAPSLDLASVPEPSTTKLYSIGIVFLGVLYWWRRAH